MTLRYETWEAMRLVREGYRVQVAAERTGASISALYRALRLYQPLREKRVKVKPARVEDVVAWFSERVEVEAGARVKSSELYADFQGYVNYRRLSAVKLNQYLRALGFHIVKTNGYFNVIGMRLRAE